MAHLRSILGRGIVGAALAGALAVGAAAPVAAHAHHVTVRDPASVTGYREQVLANDQRHAPFVNGVSLRRRSGRLRPGVGAPRARCRHPRQGRRLLHDDRRRCAR